VDIHRAAIMSAQCRSRMGANSPNRCQASRAMTGLQQLSGQGAGAAVARLNRRRSGCAAAPSMFVRHCAEPGRSPLCGRKRTYGG